MAPFPEQPDVFEAPQDQSSAIVLLADLFELSPHVLIANRVELLRVESREGVPVFDAEDLRAGGQTANGSRDLVRKPKSRVAEGDPDRDKPRIEDSRVRVSGRQKPQSHP
jgi:hypothetical protein